MHASPTPTSTPTWPVATGDGATIVGWQEGEEERGGGGRGTIYKTIKNRNTTGKINNVIR